MPVIPIVAAVGGGSALAGAATLASAGAGIYSAVKGADTARKAANQAADAAKAQAGAPGSGTVDINKVAGMAHDQAIQNAIDSQNLEKQLNPLAPQLRDQSMQAIIDQLKGGQYSPQVQQSLFDQFNQQPVSAPAFNDYGQSDLSKQSQARALSDLALGGKLDQETANQVTRSSAAHAGQYGTGLGLGHDLSARDLGLTSLQLAQQRLATAGQFGQAQDQFTAQHAGAQNAYGLNAAQLGLQQQALRAQLGIGLFGMGQQGFQNALAAGQFGNSIAKPVTGLDPGAIANLAVGNANQQGAMTQNAAAIQGQLGQGQAGLGGQVLGALPGIMSAYNTYKTPTPTPSWTSFQTQPDGTASSLIASKNLFG